MTKPTKAQIIAAVITEVHLGIAMARSRGVVCGSPSAIKIEKLRP